MSKPHTQYLGIAFDSYTPQIEAQITRDLIACQAIMGVEASTTDLVVVSDQENMDRLLDALLMRRTPALAMAKLWLQYKALDGEWPKVPETAETVYQRNLYQRVKAPNLDDGEHAPYYLPTPGRIVPDMISLLRPAPNGYAFADPWLASMF